MKVFLAFVLLFLSAGPGDIGKINTLKSEAKSAFKSGDFKTAIAKYKVLVDSLGVKEEEVMMNLANAYFQAQDTANALNAYMPLSNSDNPHIRSVANQQLGVLSNRQNKLEEALNFFKQSLKAAPSNEESRFNYEMVKKKLEEKKKQDQQNKDKDKKDDKKEDKKDDKKDQKDNKDKKDDKKDQKKDDQKKDQDKKDQDKKDQEKKDQEKKDQKDKGKDQKDQEKKDQEKKDQDKKDQQDKQDKENKDKKDIPPSVSEKLKDMQMSADKAKMILEAMKNQEMQYLQQNKRKATKPKDKGKPDW